MCVSQITLIDADKMVKKAEDSCRGAIYRVSIQLCVIN